MSEQNRWIGILSVRRPGSKSFRGNHENFHDICEMGRRLGLNVAVYLAEGMLGSEERIEAYLQRRVAGKRVWKKTTLPYPSVVYNRVPDRKAEVLPAVQRAKKKLAERGIPMFNHSFFDKRQLSEWLAGAKETAGYLPETEEITDAAQLDSWFGRSPLLYVKPVDGKAGDGILQVQRLRNGTGGWQVVAQQNGRRTRTLYATQSEAAHAVWNRVRGRAFLIQQGIDLATCRRRKFDLRMLVQKNQHGTWKVTGVGARVADADGITTHVPNGGEIAPARTTLQTAFGNERGDEILSKARETAVVFARTLEQCVRREGGLLGEISLDVGVDTSGNLWFFEANAKPMKFDEPRIRAMSLMRLLRYCEHLCRTRKKAPGV
ncbi:YheC/YheD family protein [Tumebacillus sp. ITR2]|uniref:YheC/YheD family protein n=1 Tax=Tumebacillus amylolyticus TaxID=2801339 RepID=A0ABS1JE31_9BACL|nr:YheC/YheD family protein [Tumebacillus amylolyticus]MBL0388503.1 YheC/YheD family protein [Tumebacillus amylolyticus]